MTQEKVATLLAADGEIRQTTVRAMIAVIACAGLVGLTFGYTLPLLSIIMEKAGIGSTLIGLSAASESAAILLFGPLVPRMIGALGLRNAMFVGILIGAVALGALAYFDPLYVWFPLRFVLGGTIFLVLIASDIWVTQGASAARRGRMIGIYGTAITGGMAVGALLVGLIGSDGTLPIFIGAAIFASAVLPLAFAYGPAPAMEAAGKLRPRTVLLATPLLVAAVFAFGIIDSSALSLLPVFGLHLGMNEQTSTVLVTVLVAGSILLQFPIGWLADRIDRMHVLLICAVAGTVAAIFLPISLGHDWAMWICLFVVGGSMVGLYTVSLAILGARYTGGELAAAITLFAMILAIGSTIGPLIGGGAIDIWDPFGLNVLIIGAFCLVLALALFLGIRRRNGT
ncbi:MAG: MFS transporter [Proteobacteria bacterium]|nr:MFS transporter [Pseudomonadota bacterium]MDA1355203.1 MFS transporter [Pseudomonadota bacterium]